MLSQRGHSSSSEGHKHPKGVVFKLRIKEDKVSNDKWGGLMTSRAQSGERVPKKGDSLY